MPSLPRNYQPIPYAGESRYVPSYGTLGELMGLRARSAAQGWQQLAGVFNQFVHQRQANEAAKLERADAVAKQQAAEQLKRDEMAERRAEREDAARIKREAEQEKQQIAAEKRGDARAKAIGYGPMTEMDVDTVMQSPERAGDVRYSFGPGTAEGPELQPTPDQQRTIALEKAVRDAGGIVGPNGSAHYPPKPATETPVSWQRDELMVGGKPTVVFINPRTREMVNQAGQPVNGTPIPPKGPEPPPTDGSLTPKQFSQAMMMTNSLKGHPAYTDMLDIATGWQGVNSGLKQNNGFGDIAAINAFQRMIDPGATVREGDVGLLRSASSWLDTVLSSYPIDKLKRGDKFPPAVRQRMKELAKELYKTRSKNYNDTIGTQYRSLADAAKIPFNLIGSDFMDADALVDEAPPKPKVTRDANGNLVVPKGKP